MKKTSIFIFLFIFLSFKLLAATYFVATNGSDSNSGTIDKPLLTIPKAYSKVIPGDTIYVRSGTYMLTQTLQFKKAGTSQTNYTLSAYRPDITSVYPKDGRPVIDFTNLPVGAQGFRLSRSHYWNIYGFRLTNAPDNGMIMDYATNNAKIEYCTFYHNHDAGLQIGDSANNILVTNCDSYENADMFDDGSGTGGNADGFAAKLVVGNNVIFRGCRSWRNSDDGWDGYLRSDNPILTVLENCWTWGNGYYWKKGTTSSNMNGQGFKMGGCDAAADGKKYQAHHFRLINCLSAYNKSKGFDQNNNAGSMWLYNCTSYKNPGGEFQIGNGSLAVYVPGAEVLVTNCVTMSGTTNTFRTANAATNATAAVLTTNNFNATSTDFISVDSTGLSAMRKIDGSLPDISFMHLKTGSMLINSGAAYANVNYYGNSGIPFNGTAPDLGCFQTSKSTAISEVHYIQNSYTLHSTMISDYLELSINESENSEIIISIYNLTGKKVFENIVKTCAGINDIKINCKHLRSNIYIGRVISKCPTEYFNSSFKIIKD